MFDVEFVPVVWPQNLAPVVYEGTLLSGVIMLSALPYLGIYIQEARRFYTKNHRKLHRKKIGVFVIWLCSY